MCCRAGDESPESQHGSRSPSQAAQGQLPHVGHTHETLGQVSKRFNLNFYFAIFNLLINVTSIADITLWRSGQWAKKYLNVLEV
jgi:hypothetical protein